MKQILFTAAALGALLLAAPAVSADRPVYTKAPTVAVPAYDGPASMSACSGGGRFGNHNLNNALGPVGFANYTIRSNNFSAKLRCAAVRIVVRQVLTHETVHRARLPSISVPGRGP
ncbi:hypothetical protein ACVIHI_008932 [Bradyrhizobium sp. USDA 4524]|uniref:hypothetical protein n=1 Tax=unclassified Bradyrhizobium TaxID=2631580 RepID=UPI00209E0C70|nr:MULTISPECIES: hypothetical protein [unclassified Bradyrhizobium]MCP1845600.1 hypothetical protein [Bradyrhizobium sp. USDA 4538]MCP1907077.1 hypothetical protein [Bradyrhizobium sp. USDA 4537]MCP1985552.1 hypothetical protein [Bradyrhizobium sp. USDA 4539]